MLTRPIRSNRFLLAGLALVAAAVFVTTPSLHGSTDALGETGLAIADLDTSREGPPPCLGFTIDDPCITPKALAECRRAVARCGDGLVGVVNTCPLKFVCGG